MSASSWVVGLVLALPMCGCVTTGWVDVTAPTSRYPISMTDLLADDAGLVDVTRVAPVGKFSFEGPECGLGTVDVSRAVNDQVTRAGGNAVIFFELETQKGSQCVAVRARGVIVRVRPGA